MLLLPKSLRTLLLAILPVTVLSGCYTTSEMTETSSSRNQYITHPQWVRTIRDYAASTTTQQQRESMSALLQADFQRQIDEGYTNVRIYLNNRYIVSDVMLFNAQQDKALLFITEINGRQPKDVSVVKMFTARLQPNNQWTFSDGGIPNYYYAYNASDINTPSFTESMLMDRALEDLAFDGLINRRGHIDQDYLNNHWF